MIADHLIISILDKVDKQVVIDVGSTKKSICEAAAKSKNQKDLLPLIPCGEPNTVVRKPQLKALLKI